MPIHLAALPLLLVLCGAARAGLPVELPPGEEPAVWEPAVLMAQQLLPGLELGPALGPGPSIRIVASSEAWLLDVAGPRGRRPPVRMPIPLGDEARVELLLVCADLLSREELPAEQAPAPPPTAPQEPSPWAWIPPRAQVGLGFSMGAGAQVEGVLEPGGLAWHGVGVSPRVSLSSPSRLDGDLSLRTAHLSLAARGLRGRRPILEGVLEGGVGLRRVMRGGEEALRDWTPAIGAGVGLGWPLSDGLRVLVETGLRADLPPAVLVTSRGEQTVPGWTLQVALGLAVPALGSHAERPAPPPPMPP
jgi:hypothetical protein